LKTQHLYSTQYILFAIVEALQGIALPFEDVTFMKCYSRKLGKYST